MSVSSEGKDSLYTAIRASWDADAPIYDTIPTHGLTERERWAWRRVLGRVFDPLAGDRPLRILDVGTGTGEMAMLLANMGYSVTAVDISPTMLAIARQKADRLGLPLTLLEGRADRLPLPDASLDAVFSRHLFWTLPDPAASVREWARVVRPGGMVAIADGWWNEPTQEMRTRRAIGKLLRLVFEHNKARHTGYQPDVHAQLPLSGGVSPYSIRYFLDSADLVRIRVRDLKSIRRAERSALPPWRWIDQPRHTWLASAYRPE